MRILGSSSTTRTRWAFIGCAPGGRCAWSGAAACPPRGCGGGGSGPRAESPAPARARSCTARSPRATTSCGFPTGADVHHIAQQVSRNVRVAYVDKDPMVVAHGRALLEGDGQTAVVQADLRDPVAMLREPRLAHLIDLSQPVAVLIVSVLHCVPDADDPHNAVRQAIDRLAPGSFIAISHLASDDADAAHDVSRFMRRATDWGRVRERQEIDRFFDGLHVLSPGLGDVGLWNDTPHTGQRRGHGWIEYGGVARVP
ncbi:SAM-dependent methyltransferase [Streptomyces sp. NPDC090301]|uniref:SAM-dependent methyltransferase n=1 Tax=Streptomyces sp. NPDC090301 TaxID=3154975 RepID=UPI00343681A2